VLRRRPVHDTALRYGKRVYAIDIDPDMLHRAKALVAETSNCKFIAPEAMNVEAVVPENRSIMCFSQILLRRARQARLGPLRLGDPANQRDIGHRQLALPTARGNGRSWPVARPSPSCDILNERYARREINKVEYEENTG
jgi:hypothetical protein